MPLYDVQCSSCGAEFVDKLLKMDEVFPCEACGAPTVHLWRAANVVGDDCDVWVKHGICNPDGSPRHYSSRLEMAREAKKRGLTNHVEHIAAPGTDKSKHTQRFV